MEYRVDLTNASVDDLKMLLESIIGQIDEHQRAVIIEPVYSSN